MGVFVGGGEGVYMSWKRMLERSRALEASERSIAASMAWEDLSLYRR